MEKNNTTPPLTHAKVSLRENVAQVLQHYFANLKGEEPQNVYDFFLEEIEEPLLSVIMKHTNNNQSEAARIIEKIWNVIGIAFIHPFFIVPHVLFRGTHTSKFGHYRI